MIFAAPILRRAGPRVAHRLSRTILATGALAIGVSVAGLALPATSAQAAIASPDAAMAYPRLQTGSTGAVVTYIQQRLGVSTTSGYFGVNTRQAVNSYKALHHLTVDGIVGTLVWRSLGVPKAPTLSASERGARVVAFARAQIGDSYVFAGVGPDSWDCSGLTMMAWKSVGVSLPHSAHLQYEAVSHKVLKSDLQPGDLVLWYSTMHHVGIYIGGGMAIDAPRPGLTVRITPVSSMPWAGAVRPS